MTLPRKARVLALLQQYPRGLTCPEIAEALGMQRSSVARRLNELMTEGLAIKTEAARMHRAGRYHTRVWCARLPQQTPVIVVSVHQAMVPHGKDMSTLAVAQRREIVGLLRETPLTTAALAARLTWPRDVFRARMHELASDVDIVCDGDLWQATDVGVRAYLDARTQAKTRRCLSCSTPFASSHAGNRLCPDCTIRARGFADVAA